MTIQRESDLYLYAWIPTSALGEASAFCFMKTPSLYSLRHARRQITMQKKQHHGVYTQADQMKIQCTPYDYILSKIKSVTKYM